MEPIHLITDSQQVRNWTDGHFYFHTHPDFLSPLNQPISLSSEVKEQLINELTEWRYTNLGIGDGSVEKRRARDRKVVVSILPFSSSSVFCTAATSLARSWTYSVLFPKVNLVLGF